MQKPTFDPGLTQTFGAPLRRAINKDGSFNVNRRGATWRDSHPYLHLINMSWIRFLAVVFTAYLIVNTIFAAAYFYIGAEQLLGSAAPTEFRRFLNDFFFSAQTLSTVGYGVVSPHGLAANVLSALESMLGVMGFALATGLLFGRFSRPSARIGFSERMVVARYQDGFSLQFRIVNKRPNSLMDLEARMMLMTVDGSGSDFKRNFTVLKLERESVHFFPLTWTVVHPIDAESPLAGKSELELKLLQAEVLVLIKGYDDTFSQTVRATSSYRYDEITWGAKFEPAFHVDTEGDLVLEIDKVGAFATAEPSPKMA